MIHRILYNEGAQTIVHTPPIRAASATYSIEDMWLDDGDAARVLISGSATLASASTTVDAASGRSQADPFKVSVASTTGISVGGSYWLAENGQGEVVKIRSVKTDDYVLVEHDLLDDYTTAATFQGLELSASFPAGSANDEDNLQQDRPFRVVWEYTINGAKTKAQEQIRIVRYDQADIDTTEALDLVRSMFPDLDGVVRGGSRTLEKWADVGVRLLRSDLLAKDTDPEQFLTGPRGVEALAYKIAHLAAQNGFAPAERDPQEFKDDVHAHLTGIWQTLTRALSGKETLDVTKNDQATGSEGTRHRNNVIWGL